MRDKPRPIRGLPELSAQERVAVRNVTRQRAEALYVLDKQVGGLVHTLKATGEYQNTVIMFTSDNGYFLGEHRVRQGKIRAHEPSLRVPLMISGPGVPHGQRFDPVTTEDLSATILRPRPARSRPHVPGRCVRRPVVRRRPGLDPARCSRRAPRAPGCSTEGEACRCSSTPARRSASGRRAGSTSATTTATASSTTSERTRTSSQPLRRPGVRRDPGRARPGVAVPQGLRRPCLSGPLPKDLQADPAQNKAVSDLESLGVQRRYGYYR